MAEDLYKSLRSRLEAKPDSLVFARLAELLYNSGNKDAAISLLEKGISQNPNYITGYLVLGDLLKKSAQNDRAKTVYRKLFNIDPFNISALLSLAQIEIIEKDFCSATSHLLQVFSIDPLNQSALELLVGNWDRIQEALPILVEEPREESPPDAIDNIDSGVFSLIGSEPAQDVKTLPLSRKGAQPELSVLESIIQKSVEPTVEPVELKEVEGETEELAELDEIFKAFEAPGSAVPAKPMHKVTEMRQGRVAPAEPTPPVVEPLKAKEPDLKAEEPLASLLPKEAIEIELGDIFGAAPAEPSKREKVAEPPPATPAIFDVELPQPITEILPPENEALDWGLEEADIERKETEKELIPPIVAKKKEEKPDEEEDEFSFDIAEEAAKPVEKVIAKPPEPPKPIVEPATPLATPEKIEEEKPIPQVQDIHLETEAKPKEAPAIAEIPESTELVLPEEALVIDTSLEPSVQEPIPILAPISAESPITKEPELPEETETIIEITAPIVPPPVIETAKPLQEEIPQIAQETPEPASTISIEPAKPLQDERLQIPPEPEEFVSAIPIELPPTIEPAKPILEEKRQLPPEAPKVVATTPTEPQKDEEEGAIQIPEIIFSMGGEGSEDFPPPLDMSSLKVKTPPPAPPTPEQKAEIEQVEIPQEIFKPEAMERVSAGEPVSEKPTIEKPSEPQPLLEISDLLIEGDIFSMKSDDEVESLSKPEPQAQKPLEQTLPDYAEPATEEKKAEPETEDILGILTRKEDAFSIPDVLEKLQGLQRTGGFTPPKDEKEEIEGLQRRNEEPLGEITPEMLESLLGGKKESVEPPKPSSPPAKDVATATAAEIYAAQGLTEKAIEIYIELLKRTDLSKEDRDKFTSRLEILKKRLQGR